MSNRDQATPRGHIAHSPCRLADGKVYQYAYLRYEVWDGAKARYQPKPPASLGRTDRLDEGRVESLGTFLKDWLRKDSALPFDALREQFKDLEPAFKILCSRDFGLRFLMEQAWRELGYGEAIAELAKGTALGRRFELAIFAMVLVQVVLPRSKLATSRWAGTDLFFPEGAKLELKDLYASMDVLAAGYEVVERKLVDRLRALGAAGSELVEDTTTVCCRVRYDDEERAEIEAARQASGEAVRAAVVNDPPVRMRGKSKEKRSDLPQVVLEAVLSEHQLVVHHATHPGNASDKKLVGPTIAALSKLGYKGVRWASDAGFNSVENRDSLRAASFEYVSAEGVARTKVVREVLATAGRYRQHPDKPELSFKCVRAEATEERKTHGGVGTERLYIIRRNTDEEAYVLHTIDRYVKAVEAALADGGRKAANLLTHRTYRRYVRRDARTRDEKGRPAGSVLLDLDAVEHMRQLAGKSVIATDHLEAYPLAEDDVFRQLFDLEAIFRQLKTTIEVGPIRERRRK